LDEIEERRKTMSVLLVLLMFAMFVTIDYFRARQRGEQPVIAPEMGAGAILVPAIENLSHVGGFRIPKSLRYHPGHGWVMNERRNLARVGVDDLAAKVLGPVERIQLPAPGRWVRQGQRAFSFFRDGQKVEMSSPVEGEVLQVNQELLKNPGRLQDDPYGEGWLMTVHVPDEEDVHRNLMPKNLVTSWIQEAADRLYARQPQLAGPAMAEGGEPVRDLTAALPPGSWKELAEEILQNV
jgi:glycine cleavage system H protein